jgi:hypothetical protein
VVLKEKKTKNRVPFVITYHPALSNLSNIARKHWTTIPNTHNCAKSSKNHLSWLSGNLKVWKISYWELPSPLDLPTMVNAINVIRDHVWRAKTSNAHKIQQHTYRRRIHHILQCQLQDRK